MCDDGSFTQTLEWDRARGDMNNFSGYVAYFLFVLVTSCWYWLMNPPV